MFHSNVESHMCLTHEGEAWKLDQMGSSLSIVKYKRNRQAVMYMMQITQNSLRGVFL